MTKRSSGERDDVLFEWGPFTVTPTGLDMRGRPGPDEWAAIGPRLARVRSSMQWAIGDWLELGERYDEGVLEAAAEATGLRRGTLLNLRSVSKAWPREKRDPAVGWSHHALMAGFDDEVRERLMKETKDRDLSWEELRVHCQSLRHAVRAAMQKWPSGTFGVMLATPPWRLGDTPNPGTLALDDITALAPYVQKIASPDCVLYLMAPCARTASGEAAEVLRAWGFTGRTIYAWVRDLTDRSNGWNAERHWNLIVATRGNPVPPEEDALVDSVQEHETLGAEADAPVPPALVRMIENLHPDAPKVELFAAKERFGWSAWGEQLQAARHAPAGRRGVRLRDEERPAEAMAPA